MTYKFPIICVGNLSVGGTGKSPMTEYIIRLLQPDFNVAVLSRGYKRKTAGYILADNNSNALQIGDEPYQYHRKFKDLTVAVSESRQIGIEKLLQDTDSEVILMDDAFQHRKVKAGFNILLSSYGNLFTEDLLLPAGNLRDLKKRASAADVILITKCPNNLSLSNKQTIRKKIKRFTNSPIFFTGIKYDEAIRNNDQEFLLDNLKQQAFTLVTGIANPMPLVNYLKDKGYVFDHIQFRDHHFFTAAELEELKKKSKLVTTEKDFMRLEKHIPESFYIAIKPFFLDDEKLVFDKLILEYLQKEKRIQ